MGVRSAAILYFLQAHSLSLCYDLYFGTKQHNALHRSRDRRTNQAIVPVVVGLLLSGSREKSKALKTRAAKFPTVKQVFHDAAHSAV